jgi:tellurite resistance protein
MALRDALSLLKSKQPDAFKRVQSKDLLEGMTCAALFVAAAPKKLPDGTTQKGHISDEEADQLSVSLLSNEALAGNKIEHVQAVISRFKDQINSTPRSAMIQIEKEVREAVSKDATNGLQIAAVAADVAEAEDGIDENEQERLVTVCRWCGVQPSAIGL